MSLVLHAPRPRPGHSQLLDWDTHELTNVARQLAAPDVVIKPRELHLAFNWGILRSRNFSRFRKLKTAHAGYSERKMPAMSRSSTMASARTISMTLSADVSVLITHPVRRETTYIVWGAIMAVDSISANVPPRKVLVKIAVDEEGGEDLREDARLHDNLAERGLTGYYGIFTDSIGSTALVIDDFDDELKDLETPTPTL
ncbi:hypothetical protein OH76DRAFT_1414051 [Lentinus brumalis]|uniref:Uncharacterized protein n=1 Tax=Lentinus brumalis TaxID=2498619 RepID=A0A371DV93_9APHY|nr:hypothetical protein OH76DRAFT_1414051 [Polyporus brumalis]